MLDGTNPYDEDEEKTMKQEFDDLQKMKEEMQDMPFDDLKTQYLKVTETKADVEEISKHNERLLEICEKYDTLYHKFIATQLKEVALDDLYNDSVMAIVCQMNSVHQLGADLIEIFNEAGEKNLEHVNMKSKEEMLQLKESLETVRKASIALQQSGFDFEQIEQLVDHLGLLSIKVEAVLSTQNYSGYRMRKLAATLQAKQNLNMNETGRVSILRGKYKNRNTTYKKHKDAIADASVPDDIGDSDIEQLLV